MLSFCGVITSITVFTKSSPIFRQLKQVHIFKQPPSNIRSNTIALFSLGFLNPTWDFPSGILYGLVAYPMHRSISLSSPSAYDNRLKRRYLILINISQISLAYLISLQFSCFEKCRYSRTSDLSTCLLSSAAIRPNFGPLDLFISLLIGS
jgi:hypothetical protein